MTAPVTTDRPWLDATLPITERVELLLSEMTLAEKAGLLFHSMITAGPGGQLAEADPAFGLPSTREFLVDRHLTHFNLFGSPGTATEIAEWHNRLQELAATTRLGIPVTVSTDPRHAFSDNPGVAMAAGPFSQWPETMGLAAIGDADLVQRFGDIARQEYVAVGLRVALHPQVDLATEPRWARALQTFGEDVDAASRLGAAYIRGFQGDTLGTASVATMTKHFPGGGPQLDGEDPHFAYGREQVYPGGQFELHLQPFEAAFEAGTSQIMPYYGMPIGTEHEEVGFGFNTSVITGLLRERYGFDGIVCTDWGLIEDRDILGDVHPARAWGVEHLSPLERVKKVIDAGADQFGGESCPELVVELVETGAVSEQRLDVSARRLLREKFVLGLFDHPLVDVAAAGRIVGNEQFRAAGAAAQRAAITVLTSPEHGAAPLRPGMRIYVEGIAPETAAAYGTVVDDARLADVAIVRLQAPWDRRSTAFENFFHAGSLEFDADLIEHLRRIAASTPTVVDVFLDRPAILAPIAETATVLTANWGASADALLDVLSGHAEARGRLPFDVPRSTEAVLASRPDVPFDTADPLFRCGHGLTLSV